MPKSSLPSNKQTPRLPRSAPQGSILSYITGYILSLILTLAVYLLVDEHVAADHQVLTHGFLIFAIMGLAVVQLGVQLVFFLHLDTQSRPRWNLAILAFTLVILICIVGGSLWIMNNLNYHTTSPQDTNRAIMNDEGIRR